MRKLSNIDRHGISSPGNGAGLARSTRLLRRLRFAVEGTVGRSLTYEDLSTLTNEPKSTLGNWFNGDGEPSSEILLRLLELTSEAQRREIMDQPPVCRLFPRLEHPWLAHDPVAISHVRTILSNLSGVTQIRGDHESSVTFFATALAHAARVIPSPGREVVGLDLHAPDWFVPVPGVTYLNNQLRSDRIREELARFWPKMASSKGSLILFNGTLSPGTAADANLMSVARHSHIVLTERFRSKGQPMVPVGAPAHVISVSLDKAHPERIALEIAAV